MVLTKAQKNGYGTIHEFKAFDFNLRHAHPFDRGQHEDFTLLAVQALQEALHERRRLDGLCLIGGARLMARQI